MSRNLHGILSSRSGSPGPLDSSKRQAIAGTTGSAAGSAAGTGAAVSGHAGYETQRRGRPVVANLQGTGMEQGYRPDAKRAEKKKQKTPFKKGIFNVQQKMPCQKTKKLRLRASLRTAEPILGGGQPGDVILAPTWRAEAWWTSTWDSTSQAPTSPSSATPRPHGPYGASVFEWR